MNVYVVANLDLYGGGIIGVYLDEKAAKHQAKTYPVGGPYSVYYRELNCEGVLEKHKDFLLTILSLIDSSTSKVKGDKDE